MFPLWGVFLIQMATFLPFCCLYWVKTLRLEGVMQGHGLEEAGEGGVKANLELVCTSSTAAMIVYITSLMVCFLFIDLFLLIFFFNHLGLTGKYLVF